MALKIVIDVLQVSVDIAKVVNDLIPTTVNYAELIGHCLDLASDVLTAAADFFTR